MFYRLRTLLLKTIIVSFGWLAPFIAYAEQLTEQELLKLAKQISVNVIATCNSPQGSNVEPVQGLGVLLGENGTVLTSHHIHSKILKDTRCDSVRLISEPVGGTRREIEFHKVGGRVEVKGTRSDLYRDRNGNPDFLIAGFHGPQTNTSIPLLIKGGLRDLEAHIASQQNEFYFVTLQGAGDPVSQGDFSISIEKGRREVSQSNHVEWLGNSMQGNSGGAVIDKEGQLIGIVFGQGSVRSGDANNVFKNQFVPLHLLRRDIEELATAFPQELIDVSSLKTVNPGLENPLEAIDFSMVMENFGVEYGVIKPLLSDNNLYNNIGQENAVIFAAPYVIANAADLAQLPLSDDELEIAQYFQAYGDPYSALIVAVHAAYDHNYLAAAVSLDKALKGLDRYKQLGWASSLSREDIRALYESALELGGVVPGSDTWKKASAAHGHIRGFEVLPLKYYHMSKVFKHCVWQSHRNCSGDLVSMMLASGLLSAIFDRSDFETLVKSQADVFFSYTLFDDYEKNAGQTVFLYALKGAQDTTAKEAFEKAVLAGLDEISGYEDVLLETNRSLWDLGIDGPGYGFSPLSYSAQLSNENIFKKVFSSANITPNYSRGPVSLVSMLFEGDLPHGGNYDCSLRNENGYIQRQIRKLEFVSSKQEIAEKIIQSVRDDLKWRIQDADFRRGRNCYECFRDYLFGEDCRSEALAPRSDQADLFEEVPVRASKQWNRNKGFTLEKTERAIVKEMFPYCQFTDPLFPNQCKVFTAGNREVAEIDFASTWASITWKGQLSTELLRVFSVTYGGSGAKKLFNLGRMHSNRLGRLTSQACITGLLLGEIVYYKSDFDSSPHYELSVRVTGNKC